MKLSPKLRAETTPIVPIAGTHGALRGTSAWFRPGSPFLTYAATEFALTHARPNRPFQWSTDLDLFTSNHRDWQAGGAALAYYLEQLPFEHRNLIAHSHALQVVLYACAEHGLAIRRLVSVCSPIRKDMNATAERAAKWMGGWLHVHTDSSDWTQILGSLFDGQFGIHRAAPHATRNQSIAGVGHSGLLEDPERFPLWRTYELAAFLR
jgi:hypothetical protein